jgi:hypothetical protein
VSAPDEVPARRLPERAESTRPPRNRGRQAVGACGLTGYAPEGEGAHLWFVAGSCVGVGEKSGA